MQQFLRRIADVSKTIDGKSKINGGCNFLYFYIAFKMLYEFPFFVVQKHAGVGMNFIKSTEEEFTVSANGDGGVIRQLEIFIKLFYQIKVEETYHYNLHIFQKGDVCF